MGILAFLGLGAAMILFFTTIYISISGQYTGCACEIVLFYKDAYIFSNLGLAIFFLLFSTLILTKHLELVALKNKKIKENNDTKFTAPIYTIYQLPLVQLFSKISILSSLAIFTLAIAIVYAPYDLVGNCNSPDCYIYIYDYQTFLLCYGITGIFFLLFSFQVARNISVSKKNN